MISKEEVLMNLHPGRLQLISTILQILELLYLYSFGIVKYDIIYKFFLVSVTIR